MRNATMDLRSWFVSPQSALQTAPQGACTGYSSAFAGRLPVVASLLPLAAALMRLDLPSRLLRIPKIFAKFVV